MRGRVYMAKVPMIAPVHVRVKYLEAFIRQKVFPSCPEAAAHGLHLIGHSMGGLDARFLVWKLANVRPADAGHLLRIKSITCLATPHRGSIIANRVIDVLDGKRDLMFNPTDFSRLSPASLDPVDQYSRHLGVPSSPTSNGLALRAIKWLLHSLVEKSYIDYDKQCLRNPDFPRFMCDLEPFSYHNLSIQPQPDPSTRISRWMSPWTRAAASSLTQDKETFIRRGLFHLTADWTRSSFNDNVLPMDNVYYSSYGGNITPILDRIAEDSSSGKAYVINYPWNITYPTLIEDERLELANNGQADADGVMLGNDGLVNVRASKFGVYKKTLEILHPNFSRDWSLPISIPAPPPAPGDSGDKSVILQLYDDILDDLVAQQL